MFRGNVDVPLEDIGKKDAEKAADVLEGTDVAFMVSSDKKRAVQTAEIFSKKFDVENQETPNLRAWNIGEFSGKPRDKSNTDSLQKYVNDPNTPVPGGESLQDFRDRVAPTLAECFEYATRNGIGLVVCHSSVIHELGNILTGNHESLLVEPGGIVVVGFDNGEITAQRMFKPVPKNKEGSHAENVS